MGHVQDRWYREVPDENNPGKKKRVKTNLHGTGLRYKARWIDETGRERSKMFPDRELRKAKNHVTTIESRIRSGDYLDPEAGKILFRVYAEEWFKGQCFDGGTRNIVDRRLRRQIYPYLGDRPIGDVQPTHIRGWLAWMQQKKLAGSTRSSAFIWVSAIFTAAIDDKKRKDNPCKVKSVTAPQPEKRKIVPWTPGKVAAVQLALPSRYKIVIPEGAGCGLRQGEIFGLSDVDIDRGASMLRVVRQVRWVDGVAVFAAPKGGKTRDVPLPVTVLRDLDAYMQRYPPTEVTLPWKEPDGEPEAVRLILVNEDGDMIDRRPFNQHVWAPALKRAKIVRVPQLDGMHALRHFYASVLLDAGESITALAEWLGHSDPAFTLRVYTHLMPTSADRTRRAIDGVLNHKIHKKTDKRADTTPASDGLETASHPETEQNPRSASGEK